MKEVGLAGKKKILEHKVLNSDALRNRESLDFCADLKKLQTNEKDRLSET
jgi:hypothetical protein